MEDFIDIVQKVILDLRCEDDSMRSILAHTGYKSLTEYLNNIEKKDPEYVPTELSIWKNDFKK